MELGEPKPPFVIKGLLNLYFEKWPEKVFVQFNILSGHLLKSKSEAQAFALQHYLFFSSEAVDSKPRQKGGKSWWSLKWLYKRRAPNVRGVWRRRKKLQTEREDTERQGM